MGHPSLSATDPNAISLFWLGTPAIPSPPISDRSASAILLHTPGTFWMNFDLAQKVAHYFVGFKFLWLRRVLISVLFVNAESACILRLSIVID